jgi:hypothetical protein
VSGIVSDTWLSERLLSDDPHEAAAAVLSWYRDRTVVACSSANETLYCVVPDTARATARDRSFERNLREEFGLSLEAVASMHWEERPGRVATHWSFNHCWALKPWARHLLGRSGRPPLVIHLDAHDDLAAPPVAATSVTGVFTAPVGDATLDLRDAETIDHFILRGFVGIGSFIAPIVHAVPEIEIVHVAREHPSGAEELELVLREDRQSTYTGTACRCPGVTLSPLHEPARRRYTRTSDVRVAIERARGREVVLDIDLDYFSNAFDDRRPVAEDDVSIDAGLAGAAALVDDLEGALRDAAVVPAVATVALSPGFFPSDGWSTLLPRLRLLFSHI